MRQLLLFFLCLTPSHFLLAEVLNGTARNENGQVVYTERHEISRDKEGKIQNIQSTYFDLKKNKIASLTSNFSAHPYLPDSQFEDFRFKTKYNGKNIGKDQYQIQHTDEKGRSESKTLKASPTLITGQGFANFIKLELFAKKTFFSVVEFLVIPKLDHFSFELEHLNPSSLNERHVRIRSNHFLMRLFVKKIDLYFDSNDWTLKRYVGLSNLASDSNGSQEVDIAYEKEKL